MLGMPCIHHGASAARKVPVLRGEHAAGEQDCALSASTSNHVQTVCARNRAAFKSGGFPSSSGPRQEREPDYYNNNNTDRDIRPYELLSTHSTGT